jgi:hypothetical protein
MQQKRTREQFVRDGVLEDFGTNRRFGDVYPGFFSLYFMMKNRNSMNQRQSMNDHQKPSLLVTRDDLKSKLVLRDQRRV